MLRIYSIESHDRPEVGCVSAHTLFAEHVRCTIRYLLSDEEPDGRRELHTGKKIGKAQYTEEQAERTTGHKPPHIRAGMAQMALYYDLSGAPHP